MLTSVLILIFVACGIFEWWRRNSNKDEPPALNGALPLLGHAHLLVGDCKQLWIFLKELAYECLEEGGVVSAFIGPKTVYFVSDPDDFMKIADTCYEKVKYYKFAKPWLGDGLVTSTMPIWKKNRSLLDSAFNQTVTDGFLDVFNGQARRLVEELAVEAGKGPFDHLVYIRKNAMETTCLTVLGEEFSDKSVVNSTYVGAMDQMLDILVQRFQKPWFHCDFMYRWSSLKRKEDGCLKILQDASNAVLKKRKADYLRNRRNKKTEEETNGPKYKPFVDLILELAIEEGAFTDQEIREHIDTMMFGAHDTVTSMVMCTMLLVGSHPDVQEKIFEELHAVFGDEDRDVTKQDLSQLVYLEAVLKETMRIYPIVPVITRHLDQDVKLKNCTLKKGRTCLLFIFGVYRHAMWGFDADKFKPERWLDPASMPECPATLAGFGMGKRSCIGKSHASMSMKITLAHVFRRYRVFGNHSTMASKVDVMLRTISGHHVSIDMRRFKSMLTVALLLVFLSCGILAWRRRNRNKDEPPPLPGALPLIGHLHLLLGNSSQLWNLAKKTCYDTLNAGGVISVYIGPRTAYMVTDPEDCLTVANTCLQKDSFYEFGKPWFGEGLITADVQIWKVHRKLLNPAFNQSILDGFIDVINRQARRLVKNLEVEVDKGPFDHSAYILLNVLETTCLTVMAVDFSDKCLLNSEYVHAARSMYKCVTERFQKPWLHSDVVYNWSSLKREQDESIKIMQNMSNTVLKTRQAQYFKYKKQAKIEETAKGPKFRPFIDFLLELAIEKGAFSDRQIKDHVDTLLLSGYDTTASALMYTMLLVGSYPDVQEKIFDELHDVFGDDDRDVTKQDLSQLVYLEAVLKETVRMYPLAPIMARKLDQDIKLRNYTLSNGRTCMLSAYGLHRHPMWGPDCEEFKPERWLNFETLPQCPTAFSGFGMGRRLCIGKTYAMMSMKTTLAHVFRRYRVFGNHLLMTMKIDVLLRPVSGHHVAIEMRKNKT
ncbi:uncharacterized protein LOC123877512 [Maniola jurtina]|uniref:uncharacterized protein LOC123877512 n=1 Tax=Maniola jurtina TaxID=191418 RepID=UPI001E68EB43|nr:uncharacterized protein LOC123877512 [Maniola jurtina]